MDMDIQGVENEAFGFLVKQGAEAVSTSALCALDFCVYIISDAY